MRGLAKFLMFVAFLAGIYYAREAIIRAGVREKSQEFVIATAGKISANWNRAELDRNADSNLAGQVGATGIAHPLDFAYFAQLGPRLSELNCELKDYTTFKDETRNYIAANYACAAQFEHGIGTVLMNIAREKETSAWKIVYFDVTSPSFPKSGAPAEKK